MGGAYEMEWCAVIISDEELLHGTPACRADNRMWIHRRWWLEKL